MQLRKKKIDKQTTKHNKNTRTIRNVKAAALHHIVWLQIKSKHRKCFKGN